MIEKGRIIVILKYKNTKGIIDVHVGEKYKCVKCGCMVVANYECHPTKQDLIDYFEGKIDKVDIA